MGTTRCRRRQIERVLQAVLSAARAAGAVVRRVSRSKSTESVYVKLTGSVGNVCVRISCHLPGEACGKLVSINVRDPQSVVEGVEVVERVRW